METGDGSATDLVEQYRILSEMTSDYAYKVDIDPAGGPVLGWVSDSFVRDFGYRPVGPGQIFEHVHPSDRAGAAEEWEELLHGTAVEGEIRLIPRTGGEIWVHYRARPVADPETGRVHKIYGAMRNIDERKAAEEQWRQAEAKFRAQYQASPIPTFTWQRVGDDFVLIDFNRATEEWTKGAAARKLGRMAKQVFADVPEMIADMHEAFERGRTVTRDLRRYRVQATDEVLDLLVTMVRVPPNLVMVHTIDVTAWHRAEAEREELQQRLAEGA
jgi:PAS domain S-box-containing protein